MHNARQITPGIAAEVEAWAAELQQARDRCRQIAPFSDRHPGFDLAAAYAVAARLHDETCRRGARPVGRKIGFTNPAMWALYGVREPIWGWVHDRSLLTVGERPGVCRIAALAEPRIEPEIVLHLGRAPAPGADAAALLDCIDAVSVAFELVQSHYPGWRFRAADTVADGGLHGLLLLGAPRTPAQLGGREALPDRLREFTLSLYGDGALRETGRGADVLGSPLTALAHLVALLAASGAPPLQAGELVSTGTLTPAPVLQVGSRWHCELQGLALPGLDVSFLDGTD